MFYKSGRVTACAAILTLLVSTACNRHSSSSASSRLAILRFENLGANSADDWIGRGFADVLTDTLAADSALNVIPSARLQASNQALGARPVSAPGISAGRPAALAAGATRVAYGQYSVRGNRLEATMTEEDAQTGKIIAVISASGEANAFFTVANELASHMSTRTGKYATQSAAALRAWTGAEETPDPQTAEHELEQAIAADPDFAPPYRALAEIRARRGELPAAISLLESALARGGSLPAVGRARIEADLAGMRNDPAARDRALAELAKITPGDPAIGRAQAAAALARRDFGKAAELLRGLADLEPEDANLWKQLGYTAGWAGDLNGAMEALRRYQSLKPADADPLDSEGDVNLMLGHLREAEDLYLEAAKKDPNFLGSLELFKASYARLLTGDIAGADGLFARYAEARKAARDPSLPYRQAEWDWAAGRRKSAIAGLEEIGRGSESGSAKQLASPAYTQLTVWYLARGDRENAARAASRAMATASSAGGASVYFSQFLAQRESSAEEWKMRADRLFPNPGLSQAKAFALTCALLFGNHFDAAAPVVEQFERAGSTTSDPITPVVRAWTLAETGHVKEAAAFLKWNPVPAATGFGNFWTLAFPRIYYLRGVVAATEGKSSEAKEQYRLFLKLSGPDPLEWGEEKKAQAAM